MSRPSGAVRSSPRLRFPRLECSSSAWTSPAIAAMPVDSSPRIASPRSTCSILMTSAPQSDRSADAAGTNVCSATSRMRTPCRMWATHRLRIAFDTDVEVGSVSARRWMRYAGPAAGATKVLRKGNGMSEDRLVGRRVLVMGASAGIGRVVAQRLCAAGAHVAFASRRKDACEEAAKEANGTAIGLSCDVTDEAQCRQVVDDAVELLGGLDD